MDATTNDRHEHRFDELRLRDALHLAQNFERGVQVVVELGPNVFAFEAHSRDSRGYKSGRRSWRDTPVCASTASTRSAGMRPRMIQFWTAPCERKPSRSANAC